MTDLFSRGEACTKLNDTAYMTVHRYEILSPQDYNTVFLPLGACDCDAGYTGDDCSVAETDPPELDSIEGGALIDISVGVVRQLVVYGADFVDSDKLTCHYFLSNVWGCFLCHELWDKIIQVPLNIENVKIQDFTVQYQEALVKYYSWK